MCYGTNRVELTGRVVRDIELKKSGKGESYCFFTIAVDGVKSTDFIEVKAFGQLAEDCVAHAKKGVKLSCLGRMTHSKFEKDGKTDKNVGAISFKNDREAFDVVVKAVRNIMSSYDVEEDI